MPQRVLVPMDDSGPAWNALRYAVSSLPDAPLAVLHVVDPAKHHTYGGDVGLAFSGEDLVDSRQREQASALLTEATELFENENIAIQTELKEGQPASTIVSYAGNQELDHIVIGSHGRTGVKRLLLGSVAEAVVRKSPVPVTVVREF